MWDWLRHLIGRIAQPATVAHRFNVSAAPTGDFWIATRGRLLAQGDLLRDCLLPVFGPSVRVDEETEAIVDVCQLDVIIVTQSCDLENDKAQFVALCPIYSLEEFTRINPKFSKKHERDEVRKGRHEGLHMLASPTNPANNLEALIVDCRQIYSLPIEYLSAHAESLGDRWRLQSPYLEHFSQAFARFFMRVGLPSSIPQFK